MHLSSFATEEFPLHPSSIQMLLTCPWRMAHLHLNPVDSEGGVAGDTGSAMHKAAAAFHSGKEVAESLEVMAAGTAKYPQADLVDAANLFLKYASDPRNRCVTPLVEAAIAFTIAPSPNDPTGQAIQVIGQTDQVRASDDGRLRAWDIKTSKKKPVDVLNASIYQVAAYCIGASVKLGKRVDPGGLIMPRQYTANIATSPVFWAYPWTYDDLEDLMEGVRTAVANVRRGDVYHVPNEGCFWCHMRSPDLCLHKLKQYRKLTRLTPVAAVEVLDPT